MSAAIHQEIIFQASPQQVYEALSNTAQFTAVTGGAPADISAEAGGAFSCFGGAISGRQIELVPGERIVQAWRVAHWEPGTYSIARFELAGQGSATRLTFDHVGFPGDDGEHLAQGWHQRYWEPLKQYLEG